VPATRRRHRGYADTDPRERDRASRKNYHRLLGRWKGHTDLLTEGSGAITGTGNRRAGFGV
jgi:hypothetical protein